MFDCANHSSDNLRSEILTACRLVSARLSAASGLDIKLSIATDEQLREAHYDWNPRPFDWVGSAFNDHESCCVFKLSITADEKLCGVLKACFEKETNYQSLILERVRGNPDKTHLLKGKILDAFCEVALEIAKRLNVPKIDGEEPIDEIVEIYKELGFNFSRRDGINHITMPVGQATTLNARVFSL